MSGRDFEPVALADGVAMQALIPSVAAVSPTTAAIAAERRRREARRSHGPLRPGGLFDDVARAQPSLF